MNRIDKKFDGLKAQGKKAFIAYITAGDPSLTLTHDLVLALDQAGVDIIELGVPFSDPMADGTTIQAASSRALANGTTLKKIFETVKRIRLQSQVPIALMTYYNPVFHHGEERFIKDCVHCGVDGVIIPDLPPEEAKVLCQMAKREQIATVFFVAPTTIDARVKHNAAAATGFVYYVSMTGVTGSKQTVVADVLKDLKRVKRLTTKPVCVGFGVSTREQVKEISKVADGVIVGSAIVNQIQNNPGKLMIPKVVQFVKSLMV